MNMFDQSGLEEIQTKLPYLVVQLEEHVCRY